MTMHLKNIFYKPFFTEIIAGIDFPPLHTQLRSIKLFTRLFDLVTVSVLSELPLPLQGPRNTSELCIIWSSLTNIEEFKPPAQRFSA